nr:TfoX/Sxy family protein [Lysobacter sp. GX 14042]
MRNIGPKSAAWLRQVGLRSHDDLRQAGAVEAFMRVRRAGFKPTLNLLYALEGALQDRHWQSLPRERREELAADVEHASQGPVDPSDPQLAGPVHTTVHVADTVAPQPQPQPAGTPEK